MEYACAAALEIDGRTRCRKTAKPESQFCGGHQEGAVIVPLPDVILLRPKVNPLWFGRMADEIPLKSGERKEEKIQAHIAQAERIGRKAFAIRKKIEDSGTPVFRNMEQDKLVNISGLLQELLDEGYLLTDIHGKPAKNQPMLMLTLSFDRESEEVDIESPLVKGVLAVILGSTWQYCHPWANPPNDQSKVIHTINFAHRHPPETPAMALRFAQGLWRLE